MRAVLSRECAKCCNIYLFLSGICSSILIIDSFPQTGEELRVFCETCDKPICLFCAIFDHRPHQYLPVKEAANKHKTTVMQELNRLQPQIDVLQTAIRKVEEVGSQLALTRDVVGKEVEEARLALIQGVPSFLSLMRTHRTCANLLVPKCFYSISRATCVLNVWARVCMLACVYTRVCSCVCSSCVCTNM